MRLIERPLLTLLLILLLSGGLALSTAACGDSGSESADEDDEDDDDDEDDEDDDDDEDDEEDEDEDDEDEDDDDDDAPEAAEDKPAAKKAAAPPRKRQVKATGPGASAKGAEAFKYWAPVHAFLGGAVVRGQVLSANEAIAVTKDNHVGVTTNSGSSWAFIKHTTGTVLAVAGDKGGPYIAAGKGGYMAVSTNGKSWDALPRYTADDLIAVAPLGGNIVAIGKKGAFVKIGADGTGGFTAQLPDKYKAKALVAHDGQLLAVSGKKGYSTKDGKTWRKMDALPDLPKAKEAATSKGICKIGKVGKKKGVVCEVAGMGHGAGGKTLFVENKGVISMTTDGGDNWKVAKLPFKGLNRVIGNGPYYALGGKGGLAVSKDGAAWREQPLNATKNLHDGLIDGSTILVVGDGGTIARSGDGGESWVVLPAPVSGSFKKIVKQGGTIYIPMGKKAISSGDGGATWLEVMDPTVIEGLPQADKPGTCEGRLPNEGEKCKFSRKVTTPLGLPNVKAFSFVGEVGLATGDAGLVAFTNDGGANWKARNGFSMKRLQGFDVKDGRIVAIGGKVIVVSTDGGASWKEAQLPKKAGKIFSVLIADDGAVYAGGAKGTIIKAEGALNLWLPLNTGEKNKTNFVGLYEVAGNLYGAGARGELYRSADQGASWEPVPTGLKEGIQKMAGEGDTVLAVTWGGRKSGNLLLRSNDGGRHFFVQREISHNGRVRDFSFEGGEIRYQDRASSDFGATWTQGIENYWWGAVDVADGSGLRIVNRDYGYSKDRLFVVGSDKEDWTIIDSAYNEGAWFRCDAKTGCWMVAGGQVYRPL